MIRDRSRGIQRNKYALDPASMARACRKLAKDLRIEHSLGYGPVSISNGFGNDLYYITRLESAESLEATAKRWDIEANGGPKNVESRIRLGLPV